MRMGNTQESPGLDSEPGLFICAQNARAYPPRGPEAKFVLRARDEIRRVRRKFIGGNHEEKLWGRVGSLHGVCSHRGDHGADTSS
jgi:hypothetical protein